MKTNIRSLLRHVLPSRYFNIHTFRPTIKIQKFNYYLFSRTLSRPITTAGEPFQGYDKYREINPDILRTLQLERQHTIDYVDRLLKSVPGNVTRSKIEDEIHTAALKCVDRGFAESGPTGKYEYFFNDSPVTGTRTYQRRDLQKCGHEQIVCSYNFNHEELGAVSLSKDEKYAVRVVSPQATTTTNHSFARIMVRDIDACVDFQVSLEDITLKDSCTPPRIHNVEFGPTIEGTSDQLHSLFITTCDVLGRPHAVYVCIVSGEERSHSKPQLIFVDHDGSHFVDVQRTKGCDYVAIHSTSKSSNEIRLVGGDLRPILVRSRQDQVQYYVDCGVDKDVVIIALMNPIHGTNKQFQKKDSGQLAMELGQEFSIFEATIGDLPLKGSFGNKLLFDHQNHEKEGEHFIEDMDVFDSKIVFYERSNVDGLQRMRVWDRKEKNHTIIPFPLFGDDERFVLSSTGNMNYFSSSFHFTAESPTLPPKCFCYDFESGNILSVSNGPNEDKDNSTVRYRRILVDSSNEIKCPMTIVHKSKPALSGRPVILVGYGCYGQNQNLQFDPSIIPLINRGFAVAFCHGRGGRELGHKWYQSGIRQSKIRSIEDYLACAKFLKSNKDEISVQGSATDIFLVAKGFSAGGVVVGSSLNMAPALFQAAVLSNAFLDVMGAMSDSSSHLTEHEWDEFGNPLTSAEDVVSISSYCPMNNIRMQRYPPCIIVGAVDDDMVPFYHSLFFGKRIRNKCINVQNDVCINLEENGGHQLSGEMRIKLEALAASFIIGLYNKWLNGHGS